MRMSTLTRRVQILLDEQRHNRLEREAARKGTSVAALIREAIDRTYPSGPASRAEAAASLLSAPPMPVEDWAVMKEQMLDELASGEA
jgi:hypothetical protein